MKMEYILLIICLNIWIISSVPVQASCTDDYGSSWCTDCTNPAIVNFCKKTCKVCKDTGCNQGYFVFNGTCTSCIITPKEITDSHTTSCGKSCSDGNWGLGCNKTCNTGCRNNTCERWTGRCIDGCKPCYHGSKCDRETGNCICNREGECKCKKPFYGTKCLEICSEHCRFHDCDDIGDCKDGCKPGYYGRKCDTKYKCYNCKNGACSATTNTCEDGCKPGYYTMKCNVTCSRYCKDDICSQENGTCDNGCKSGWFNDTCNSKCPVNCKNNTCRQIGGICDKGCKKGYYGEKCDQLCPNTCNSSACNQTNGRCDEGCKMGYHGEKCNKTCHSNCNGNICSQDGRCDNGCRPGWFSDKCNTKCSANCSDSTCSQDSGRCDKGCFQGWFGDQCNKACPENCVFDSCNRTRGSCQGCKDGYKGSHCNTPCSGHCTVCDQYEDSCSSCSPGWYGDKCEESCGNCIGGVCNTTNGYCVRGCKIGFYDSLCRIPCNAHCQERGGIHCTRYTGSCSDGCKDGWFGDRCESECSSGCKHDRCNRTTGACTCSDERIASTYGDDCTDVQGLVFLWVAVPSFLIILLLVMAFLVLKRSKRKKSYNLRSGIFGSTGRCANMFSLVNPSYISTPKGSSTPNNEENFESQPLTEGDKEIRVQRQADVKKKEDPFYRPARIQPHIFSSHIPCIPAEDEVGRSDDTPFHCQLPDEPQLGCIWSTEVRVEKFREYVKTMKRNLGLTNQFFDLPYGRLGPCDEGERQVNAFKNRYRNILPYDHSRVTLRYIDGIPGSDYFNANYINGYGKPRAFVASQGPYVDVLWDFWRMVWEIDTDKIVMLTNLVENRKNKCEQYWPDTGELLVNYDGVFVQCVTEKHLEDYIERTFTVQMENQPTRIVKQYHFTTWPDKGVPQDVTSLVDFHQVVKQSPASRYGPIIVHCSAGVGRTGTFLALDYLIAQAKAEGVIDVYECVTRIRHQRMDAIQTEEQYIFLHDALVEALPSGDRPSKEGTGTHKTKKRQRLNHPSKRRPESPRNPFIDQNPSLDDKRYQTSRLPDIPLETFSSLLSTTPGRRS